jgi:hypothetical protein
MNLFLSAISTGLEIGFTVLLMTVVFSLFKEVVQSSFLHVQLRSKLGNIAGGVFFVAFIKYRHTGFQYKIQ